MSRRAIRRLQAAAELPLQDAGRDDAGASSGDDLPTRAINAFLLLGGDAQSDSEPEETAAEKDDASPVSQKKTPSSKQKKKKTKAAAAAVAAGEVAAAAAPTVLLQPGEDEIDASLREINAKFGALPVRVELVTDDGAPGCAAGLRALFALERRFLNADTEMARRFGSQRVKKTIVERNEHGQYAAAAARRRTTITTPRPTWPLAGRLGLQMSLVGTNTLQPEFILSHNREYQEVQVQFLEAVGSLDPQAIGAVLHAHPYHVDSLLQLSEVLKVNGDSQTAADFVERALYCFERSFHSLFSVTSGQCRLDYARYENRALFIALFRHIDFVAKRGVWRTALELTKLLLSLSPDDDPLGSLLMIDFYALQAGEHQWLVRLCAQCEAEKAFSWLPNFAFSLAFAQRALHPASPLADNLLQQAIMRFPHTVLAMADKLNAHMLPALLAHPYFQRPASPTSSEYNLAALQALYVAHTHSLWKPADMAGWLHDNALAVMARVNAGTEPQIEDCQQRRKFAYASTPLNVQRHIVLRECQSAMSALPPSVNFHGVLAHDPLPPPGVRSVYDELLETRAASRPSHSLGAMEVFLRSMLPGFSPVDAATAARARGATEGVGAHLLAALDALGLRDLIDDLNVAPGLGEDVDDHDDGDNFD